MQCPVTLSISLDEDDPGIQRLNSVFGVTVNVKGRSVIIIRQMLTIVKRITLTYYCDVTYFDHVTSYNTLYSYVVIL